MSLELLHTNAHISISYDNRNNWLYLDWQGDQTLTSVRESCLLIAQCFLQRSYKRVLNDNSNVDSFTPEVFEWLSTGFLPYMHLAQIEYVAWVLSANIDQQFYTDIALYKDSTPVVALFEDLASAYSWLCDVSFKPAVVSYSTQTAAQKRLELESRIAIGRDSVAAARRALPTGQ